jgi:hypothetical protein
MVPCAVVVGLGLMAIIGTLLVMVTGGGVGWVVGTSADWVIETVEGSTSAVGFSVEIGVENVPINPVPLAVFAGIVGGRAVDIVSTICVEAGRRIAVLNMSTSWLIASKSL